MIESAVNALKAGAGAIVASWVNQVGGTFLAPKSSMFVGGLLLSLLLAAWLAVPRGHRRLPRVAVLARALFPRRLVRSASGRADIAYFLFGMLVFALAFSWAFASTGRIAEATAQALTRIFGAPRASPIPLPIQAATSTVILFLAYEFAYWFDHYLSHKLPILWQFHRVHHAAESLSLLTNFRVHPVDTIVFANIVALCLGVTSALLGRVFGTIIAPIGIGGTNILTLVCAIGLTHLQHSHLWIGFGPRWSRLLLGPAHHQIHHSADPRHHDRNFGSSLAVWDRIFGTLHVPSEQREPLRFGLGDDEPDPHGWRSAVVTPVVRAARVLSPSWVDPDAPAPVTHSAASAS
jgi:sterol desaturase/sphingolipid hydroxylase (fatty acid hydroxylase superfamily)